MIRICITKDELVFPLRSCDIAGSYIMHIGESVLCAICASIHDIHKEIDCVWNIALE